MARGRAAQHSPDLQLIAEAKHWHPHSLLGAHRDGGTTIVRTIQPHASEVEVVTDGGSVAADRIHPAGVFEAQLDGLLNGYRLRVKSADETVEVQDPYRFSPTLGELDTYLIAEGRHEGLWQVLGANPREHEGVRGVAFAVWAPGAAAVRVVGDFNGWDGRRHQMRSLGSTGVWEIFIPAVAAGSNYKFEIVTRGGEIRLKADPLAKAMEAPPKTASVVAESNYEWGDAEWLERRASVDPLNQRISVYEVHLGSWRRRENDRTLTYRELADELGAYAQEMGFTHVELLPISEHPFTGSWGYQVSAYFAPTARYGSPDDFRYFVDSMHQRGIGVIIDWVPAHFPKDDFALARFDGTHLYEHSDPRQGEHPDWGTLIFNFGRNEVRNFLVANAMYWLEEFHIDGLRVDAVASMIYLDYSREQGEWVPNIYGGRENLEAIETLKEMNVRAHGRFPGVLTIAEESTAWPGVSRPTHLGGLGFGLKWNMGWMHDTLDYFSKDPLFRKYHHERLTFGLLYAFHENFVLPLSHDEVVHGKGSLLNKMPGDRWQQMANLRALFAWMWAHPGKQTLFMGGELAQDSEWSVDRSLDWQLLEQEQNRGIQALISELNRLQGNLPALFLQDFDSAGFRWIDANDNENNVFSFYRTAPDARPVVCIANLSPVPRQGYRIGMPEPGVWSVALNTDEGRFSGSGMPLPEEVTAGDISWHGLPQSVELDLPPLAVLWLAKS